MCGNILKYKMGISKNLKLLSKMEGTKFLSAVGQFSGSNIYLIMDVIYSILWRRKQLNTLFSLSDYKFFINSKWTRLELPKTRLCFLLIILSVDFRYPHLRLTFESMRCIYIFLLCIYRHDVAIMLMIMAKTLSMSIESYCKIYYWLSFK